MSSMGVPVFSTDFNDVSLLQHAVQSWNSGNQAGATDALRPRAEAGAPWAATLMAWLLMQQGTSGMHESITWAIRAAQLGAPGQISQTFSNALAHLPSEPGLALRLPDLLRWAGPSMGGNDIAGQAWNLVSQGRPDVALEILSISTPWLTTDLQWTALIEKATEGNIELEQITYKAREHNADIDAHVSEAKIAIDKARDGLETSARQAGLLVSAISSDATNSLFKADAKRNAEESTGAWRWGLGVLGAAALVAILPVVLHYFKLGPGYSAIEQIGVHLASTAALATFAGVLLARARSRDHAAQRAHDLSTAMGTMISYSNQISDPIEKQRFMMSMGQVVLQAHLTTGSGQTTKDDSISGMLALAQFLRPTTISGPPAASPN
jgi:hypothetical protein